MHLLMIMKRNLSYFLSHFPFVSALSLYFNNGDKSRLGIICIKVAFATFHLIELKWYAYQLQEGTELLF